MLDTPLASGMTPPELSGLAPVSREQAIAELTAPGQAYELTEVQAYGRRVRWFANGLPHLRALYESTASDAPFLIWHHGPQAERWSFVQAWADASRIGHLLVHEAGIQPGDHVALALRNYPEWVLAFCAITSIGAVAVALNSMSSAEDMAYTLEHSQARVLIADAERLQALQTQAPELITTLRRYSVRAPQPIDGATDLRQAMQAQGTAAMPTPPITLDDPATLLYTSGSTGRPKGVLSSHRNVLAALHSWELDALVAARSAGTPLPSVPHSGTLLAVPLFHVTGLHAIYLASYRTQRRLVTMTRWDAAAAAELIEREQLTSFIAPAAMTGDLVRHAEATGQALPSLLQVGGGGAPRAPDQVRRIHSSLANAMPGLGWGMTETNAIGAGIQGQDYLDRPLSTGRCSLVLDMRIVDGLGQVQPPGQPGELQIRGTAMFTSYWRNPEATRDAHVDGDWFCTGDVARIDEDGFVYIVDRIKELIIRGGENISCARIEAALLTHPLVYEAAAYAVPDERLGEEIGVTLYASDALDEAQLRTHLSGHLARHEIPRYLQLLHEPLPRTGSGKLLKRELKARALSWLAQQDH